MLGHEIPALAQTRVAALHNLSRFCSGVFWGILGIAVLIALLFVAGCTTSGNSNPGNPSPGITSANSTTFLVGTAGTFTLTATGTPAPTLSEAGTLPAGVTFNAATGALSGTPSAGTAGTYPITFTAHNGAGADATQNFTLTVNQAAAITSTNSTTFTVGTAGTFTVTATGSPTPTLSETGSLPTGVTFTAATGTLSGMAAASTGGMYSITFTAHNGVG